jgi:hypothetical protein
MQRELLDYQEGDQCAEPRRAQHSGSGDSGGTADSFVAHKHDKENRADQVSAAHAASRNAGHLAPSPCMK